MSTKRGAARGVKLPRRKGHAKALDELPPEPTPEQLQDAAINVSLADLEERVADVCDSWETDSLFEDAFEAITEESSASSSTTGSKLQPLMLSAFLHWQLSATLSKRWKCCQSAKTSANSLYSPNCTHLLGPC